MRSSRAAGTEQYGSGHSAGPAALVTDVRAATAALPSSDFGKLDLENAFDRVERNDALLAVREDVPGMAKLMATVWGSRGQRLRRVEPWRMGSHHDLWQCLPGWPGWPAGLLFGDGAHRAANSWQLGGGDSCIDLIFHFCGRCDARRTSSSDAARR